MNDGEKKEFLVQDAKTYKFLSNGNLPVPGVNDSQEFEDTKEAMVIMGMSDDEQAGEEGGREGRGGEGRGGEGRGGEGR